MKALPSPRRMKTARSGVFVGNSNGLLAPPPRERPPCAAAARPSGPLGLLQGEDLGTGGCGRLGGRWLTFSAGAGMLTRRPVHDHM